MGGLGSGPYGYGGKRSKAPTGNCYSLDIRRLKRDKLLQPGMSYGWKWTTSGRWGVEKDREGSIGIYVASADEMQLSYTVTKDGAAEPIKQSIVLEFSPCNYSGERIWFCCPWCNKRVALLFMKGTTFRCRHCHDLTYYSCRESGNRVEETLRRATAALDKLKHEKQGRLDIMYCRPIFKPKGMHQSTFTRLRNEFITAQSEYIEALNASMAGALAGLKRRTIG